MRWRPVRAHQLLDGVLADLVDLLGRCHDPEARDVTAFLAVHLRGIGETIEGSAQAWDDRNYWKKSEQLRADPSILPPAPDLPSIATLGFERAMPGPADAFFAAVEEVAYEVCAGRIAAEIVAPSPPGVPRLVPGQRIDAAHVAWLVANCDAGMFVHDPVDPSQHCLRVVAADAPAAERPAMFAAKT